MRWAKKGSYFYVIDAFIAGIIIIAGVAVIFSQYVSDYDSTSTFFSAEDFFSVLEDTEIRNVDSTTVKDWVRTGKINDSSRSLLEQLALFNSTGQGSETRQFANILIANLPENIAGAILIENFVIAETPNPRVNSDESEVFFSSKRIVLIRGEPWEIYPPILIEVQTWQ